MSSTTNPNQTIPIRVGELRDIIANMPDDTVVVIATDNWYVNIGEVVVPNEDDGVLCLTLYPGAGFDSRFDL